MTEPTFPAGWTYDVYWLATTATGASADCAVVRWDPLTSGGRQTVAVIDAGRNANDLERLLTHLHEEVGRTHLDYLIGTHSDRDHIGNFPKILTDENLTVGELWVHDPRLHLDVYDPDITNGRDRVVASINDVHDVNRLADDVTLRREPFAGLSTADGVLSILGPSRDYYRELLPQIFTQEEVEELPGMIAASLAIDYHPHAAFEVVLLDKAEDWKQDNLATSNPQRPSNDVSVITLLRLPGPRHELLTGDASSHSFVAASSDALTHALDPSFLRKVQLPHHGSWNNVTSELLDNLLGPILGSEEAATEAAQRDRRVCVVQAGAVDPHHPSGRVSNAAIRRGWNVLTTGGRSWRSGNYDSPEGSIYHQSEGASAAASPYLAFDPEPQS